MKIKEVIEYLNSFNQESEFCITTKNGQNIEVKKTDFGWCDDNDGDSEEYDVIKSKQNAISVSICLNENEK